MLGLTNKILWINNYIKLTLLDLSQGINIWNLNLYLESEIYNRVITSRESNVLGYCLLKNKDIMNPSISIR